MRIHGVGVLLLLGLAGCALSRDVSPVVQSRAELQLSLAEVATGTYQLAIHKTALADGTEFLLSTSAILTGSGDPQFQGSLSHVVSFKRADGKVQMLESPQGVVVDAALVKPNVIASFPIVAETDTIVGLGFNEGAASALTSTDWTTSDGAPDSYLLAGRFSGIALTQRYVDEGRTDDAGRITIRQVAQADDGYGQVMTLELRYFLRPYQPDPTYEPLLSNQDFRWVGYIESAPTRLAGTASSQRYVSRFNPNEPLIYAISANTPAAVKPAIRDGILYWNRVLGREWIQVIDAPAGVVAPDLAYNLVQWVPERGAQFAYADAQLDPLTGQVQNAQVFFPSAWYDSAGPAVVDSFARYGAERPRKRADAHAQPQNSKHAANACTRVDASVFAQAARVLLTRGHSELDVNRVALDWVRSALAHEVGHTLGLRHNFAGSLGSNIDPSETDGLMEHYFATGDWPADKVPGSSVMEYPSFEDDVAIGARIRLGQPPLAYDVAAIGALYNGTAPSRANPALFCTDSQLGLFADCAQGDSGANIVRSLAKRIEDATKNAALEYLYRLRAAKLQEIPDIFAATDGTSDALAAYYARFQVATLLSSNAQLLVSDRSLGSPVINAAQIHADSLARVGEAISAGEHGFEPFFARLPKNFDTTFLAQLNALLGQSWYTQGVTDKDRPWAFSADEIARIKAYAPEYLALYHAAAEQADISVLSLQDPLASSPLSAPPGGNGFFIEEQAPQLRWEVPVLQDDFLELLTQRLWHYETAHSGTFAASVIVAPTGAVETPEAAGEPAATPTATTLELPIFTYSTALRTQAASLLNPIVSGDRVWAYAERKTVVASFQAFLDDAAGGSFAALSVDGSDPEAQRWILDNNDVLWAVSAISQ